MKDEELRAAIHKLGVRPYKGLMYAPSYPVSATLTDGTVLPCVLIESADARVSQALRRIKETQGDSVNYPSYVKNLATAFNNVSHYDISSISECPFALPAALHEVVSRAGETAMSHIAFVGTFTNGTAVNFASSYELEFFSMPEGLRGTDLKSVKPHRQCTGPTFRTRPYFSCFI